MEMMVGPMTKELVSVEPLIDRISDLPWEIVNNILGRLPIKDVVATTILSKKWNDKWVDVSKLVFDDDPYGTGIMDSVLFSKLVDHVLLSHRGPIEEFVFVSHSSESFKGDIQHWISFLGRCDVKELTFYFSSNRASMPSMPSSLFSCKQLRHVRLTNCCLSTRDVPLLKTLVSMQLTRCYAPFLEPMINSSPNLEKLVLENTFFMSRLTIRAPSLQYLSLEGHFKEVYLGAPSLKYLSLEGDFKEVYLENCTLLDVASFKMRGKVEGTSDGLVQVPDWLSRLRRLVTIGPFLKFLAERYHWDEASIDCHNLEVLELDEVDFDDSDELATTLSILRSSNNLNVLLINCLGTYARKYALMEAHNQEKYCFNKLRIVRITILRTLGTVRVIKDHDIPHMRFPEVIGIILYGSPVLENMHIHYTYVEGSDFWFRKLLMLCERASSQLKLKYNSRQGDLTCTI